MAVHGLFLFIAIKVQESDTSPEDSETFHIVFKEAENDLGEKGSGEIRKVKSSPNQTKSQNRKKFQFQDFAPYVVSDFFENSVGSESGDSEDTLETMNGMGLSEYSANRNFFERILKKVDIHTAYADELVEHKMEGKVWAKVLVNSRGQLIKILDASGKNAPLESYVIVGIYQALQDPMPVKHAYMSSKTLALHFHFEFKRHTLGMQQDESEGHYFKNTFHFSRLRNAPNFHQELTHQQTSR